MRCHLCILDHLEETTPNQGSAQNISDWVDVLNEEVKWHWVDYVFGKGVVLEVEQNCFVTFRSIKFSNSLSLR